MTFEEQEAEIRRQERRVHVVAVGLFLLTMILMFVAVGLAS